MTYEVIARKWRPKVFEDLIGQGHIARTLQNALTKNRVGHAYLFAGLRGIGKTSVARVFARTLRCEKRGADANPCNTCPSCLEILEGRAMDVLEIDGASNNGVDSIRELRDRAHYMPTSGHYKIYIIDEVHMLSASAFNALLKILEEPPPHLVFMFATTEPQDIPETILSRVQRFDLKRIAEPVLMKHLQHICQKENLTVETGALKLIAGAAEGSMRDGQSMLDQLVAYGDNAVTTAMAEEVLGLVGHGAVSEMLDILTRGDAKAMLAQVHRLYVQGLDLHHFFVKLMEAVRDCSMIQLAGADALGDVSDDEFFQKLKALSERWDALRWRMAFQVLSRGFERLAHSPFPKVTLEMTLARVLALDEVRSVDEALQALENGGGTAASGSLPTSTIAAAITPPGNRPTPTVAPAAPTPAAAPSGAPTWAGWLALLKNQRPTVAMAFDGAHVSLHLPVIQVKFKEAGFQATLLKDLPGNRDLAKLAKEYFHCDIHWKLEAPQAAGAAKAGLTTSDEKAQKVVDDERVKLAQKYLGAEVESVKLFHND